MKILLCLLMSFSISCVLVPKKKPKVELYHHDVSFKKVVVDKKIRIRIICVDGYTFLLVTGKYDNWVNIIQKRLGNGSFEKCSY